MVKNVAGEGARSEPGNQTSVRFRSGAMVKTPELVGNILQLGAKNQMKWLLLGVWITKNLQLVIRRMIIQNRCSLEDKTDIPKPASIRSRPD